MTAREPAAPARDPRRIPEPATPAASPWYLGWRRWRRLRREAALLRDADLFDADWYRSRWLGSPAADVDPVRHYLLVGADAGLDPGPAFSGRNYLLANPDVAAAGLNPLVHYLRSGRAEDRPLSPLEGSGARVALRPPLRKRLGQFGRRRWRELWRAVVRNLIRPLRRYEAVPLPETADEAELHCEDGTLPSAWCLISRPREASAMHLMLLVGERQALELELGGGRSAYLPQLVRLLDRPVPLAVRCDPRPGEETTTGDLPARIDIREIGHAEAVLRLLAHLARQPSATRRRLREGSELPLLRRAVVERMPREPSTYQSWVRRHDTPSRAQLAAMRARAAAMRDPPRFSVIVPTYNTPADALAQMIGSVRSQVYPHWELCIADDASTLPHVATMLHKAAREEPRIRLRIRERNGNIVAASNTALSLATGDYAALLDHDDVLPQHALLLMAEAIRANPDADMLYSDEDKLDAAGRRYGPYFKPDYSPELLWAQNLISHLGVYRLSMLRAIGGFREGFDGSQDYDLSLRVAARTRGPIVHVPHVLYHWRLFPGAPTFSSTQTARATEAARRAIVDQAASLGETISVTDGVGHYHRAVRPPPTRWPSVTAIVPTRDHVDVLRVCLDGLRRGTDYPRLDIIVVDNGSEQAESLDYLRDIEAQGVRVLPHPGPFNYSALNNAAAREATGELLLLLNSDISMADPGWLREMVQSLRGPRVGAVGARLLYPDRHVQHAGVVLGLGGVAGHPEVGASREDPGYFGRLMMAREVSAVTAACLLVPRDLYWSVGGLDAENLPVAFNDVDFCLRLREAGWRVVWTPHAELIHHESRSRGSDFAPERIERFRAEIAYMQRRWKPILARDPFYNPNLSLETQTPVPAFPPRVARPWDDGFATRAAETAAA